MTHVSTHEYQFLKNPSAKWLKWNVYVGITLAVMVLEFVGVLKPLRTAGEKITTSLMELGSAVVRTMTRPYQIAIQSTQNYQRVQDLELRYGEALAKLAESDQLKQENADLRAMLGSTPSAAMASRQVVLGTIIAYGQPTLKISSDDRRVLSGAAVLVAQTVIGRITKIEENTAQLNLLSNSAVQPVLARTESGVTGIVKGNGRDVLLQEIPSQVSVQLGEQVITIGQPGIESGLSLGRISAVRQQATGLTQEAVIDQSVSFYNAQIVEVRP